MIRFLFLLVFILVCFSHTSYAVKRSCYEVFDSAKEEVLYKMGNRALFIREYKDQSGYASFVENLERTDSMDYVFILVFSLLSAKEKRELAWQLFQGTVKEYRQTRSRILDENGKQLREEYKGMEGYALFALRYYTFKVEGKAGEKSYYDGRMEKAYRNVSAVLRREQMRDLSWKLFKGTVKEYRQARSRILDESGKKIRQEYTGMDGYAAFAEKYYNGDMKIAFVNISAILTKEQMQDLSWQVFHSNVREYWQTRSRILDETGELREEYKGMDGYATFALKYYPFFVKRKAKEGNYYDGRMSKAYDNVSAILTQEQMQDLSWRYFKGTVREYQKARFRILDESGKKIRQEYIGVEGYVAFAEKYYEGDMKKTYANISAVLGGVHAIKKLGLAWKVLACSVSQFEALKRVFEAHNLVELRDMQTQIAQEIFRGDEIKTYDIVSTVREYLLGDRKSFTMLNWHRTIPSKK